jgi:hypothetical protein
MVPRFYCGRDVEGNGDRPSAILRQPFEDARPDRAEERLMLTRIDHVMICVPDLQRGIDTYSRIGFNIYPGGAHVGRGTHNAIAFLQDDYLTGPSSLRR